MAAETAQDKLVAELRRSDVGPPTIPEEPAGFDPSQYKVKPDAMLPLLDGALRTDMVRYLVATLLGTGAACAGGLGHVMGWLGQERATLLGALGGGLVVWSLLGLPLPGAVPFLEVKTAAGFYCKKGKRNEHVKRAFEGFMANFLPTPFIRSGEWCTVLPFFWTKNKARKLNYERAWVLNPNDKEHLACDWVFPPGGYDPSRPVVLLFTGLGPSAHWREFGGFVANTAWHLTMQCNMTAVVVVARGTMDTQVKDRPFHGARMYDAREPVLLAERAMRAGRGEAKDAKTQLPMFASGFSMGAIIIANYCGTFGADAKLAGVVHFSGMYDAVFNMTFTYSSRTWQSYLAYGLKANILCGRLGRLATERGVDMKKMLSGEVKSVVDLDETFVAVYNGYKGGVKEYYEDMGLASADKWKNVKIPVLAVCARDDPITHCDSLRAEEFSAANENLLFLVTERGGHVGWPWGMTPWTRGFDFMSEGIVVFIESVLSSK